MTTSGDFGVPDLAQAQAYPVVFGISVTPRVGGIAIGLGGFGIAAYLLVNLVMPVYTQKEQLDQTIAAQNQEALHAGEILARYQKVAVQLQQVQAQQQQVLNIFASPGELSTLLIDLDRIVRVYRGKLLVFNPVGGPATINDQSLGEGVKGKLQQQVYHVEMEGNFEDLKEIFATLERLQPLLLVQNLSADLNQASQEVQVNLQRGQVVIQPNSSSQASDAKIKATFDLVAVLPVAATPPTPASSPGPAPK